MKVTSVYAMALFATTAVLLVAPQATAAPGPAEAELSFPVTKRRAVSPPETSAPLTTRAHRRSNAQQRFQKRGTDASTSNLNH
ncbi:hypothetical protein H4R33_001589 [Dimargaris cristalligena]|uniref:Secreted protein n=1 Tax=Dimargaris cristalligena TaxID=215637 RepID=A0A4P9ZQL8_9FUNG|nr:hypothetical protein H4R33_001589 [Dimargaris cristalligena]RKP35784.1 hypothetical protein BJ085DRAFT_41593 [Dimargaris cristalligena]|eukprot:RKP35784.1 hypothetical protein BJ085DRAFT_41593 [Dimargaris cristalligena]